VTPGSLRSCSEDSQMSSQWHLEAGVSTTRERKKRHILKSGLSPLMCVSFANFSASNGSPVSPPFGLRVRLVALGPGLRRCCLGYPGFLLWRSLRFGCLGLGFSGGCCLAFLFGFPGESSSSSPVHPDHPNQTRIQECRYQIPRFAFASSCCLVDPEH
jgi:hypothetical protein